ncbi:MAG: single-stranded-DNA-specific exonuclease RecJ [Deltaproteobacteria bacterium]|nr:MAG: single-stranded-DNA-specific exonuclease RecJ [Deltaproteobacteria bacterium]
MDAVSRRRWFPRGTPPDNTAVGALALRLGLPPLVARLLLGRGLPEAAVAEFLSARLADLPDPFLLPDMERAAGRIAAAVRRGEEIAVHGDYDVDGMSGTALLVEGLRACGASAGYHIPLRLKDGYGLSEAALRDAAAGGRRLVVSVDCGVSAHGEARLARELGLDLIITDHHQPPPQLPEAFAVINPQRADSAFPFRDLAGVGVAFFLLVAVRRELRESGWFAERPEPDLRAVLDLVALGTIADLVPLQGVNRTLTRIGLGVLERGERPGIRALRTVSGIGKVNCGTVAFQLAPRLNAAGRLDDASRGVELLLGRDVDAVVETAQLLDRFNRDRQQIELQTLEEATAMVAALPPERTHSIVLACDAWHPGVIGIVASRLVERYYRPTVLIAMDGEGGKGSARSIRGLHLYRALHECAGHLLAFGGHEMAAGLSVAREQVETFSLAFEAAARQHLSADDLAPSLLYDGTVSLAELPLATIAFLESLAPFGMGNPEPVFLIERLRGRQLQKVGGSHLRFLACREGEAVPAIAFGMADRLAEFQGDVDLLVSPQVNRYNGRETVQLRVRDVRSAAS